MVWIAWFRRSSEKKALLFGRISSFLVELDTKLALFLSYTGFNQGEKRLDSPDELFITQKML
jgi:hypothetical protein